MEFFSSKKTPAEKLKRGSDVQKISDMIEFPSRQSKHGFNQVDTYIILLSDQEKIVHLSYLLHIHCHFKI